VNHNARYEIMATIGIACAVAAVGTVFILLNKYVKKTVSVSVVQSPAVLQLVDVPAWASEQLKERIYAAARVDADDLKLNGDAARLVQQNIQTLIAWLDDVKVQTTNDCLLIKARWRRPVALVKSGLHKFYVDAELVVLDFLPMPHLPIVQIKGLPLITKLPSPGEVWQRDDLAAAIVVLAGLEQMDRTVTPDKPLLYEIESIDVSNFQGRQNSRHPHIVLYAKDKTEIIWGAEFGKWQQYLEATDEQKLAKLYSYYREYGSLLGGAKYINLCDPQDKIPLPIDKY